MIKQCSKCKEINKHRKRPDRKNSFVCYCMKCESLMQKYRHSSKKQRYVNILGGKCLHCEIEDHWSIYDFHHLDSSQKIGEIFKIPSNVRENELLKCILLCGMCHRKENHKRRIRAKDSDLYKICKNCNLKKPHALKSEKYRPDTFEKRLKINVKTIENMKNKWKIGQVLNDKKSELTKKDFINFCKKTYNIGIRSASDYIRLYKNYSLNNVPNSLNAIKKRDSKKLLDVNKRYFDYICRECKNEKTKERIHINKREAVNFLGGKCKICDFETEDLFLYDFHHLDPNMKEYKISSKKIKIEKIKKELEKCVLLCCHCHRKLHAGAFIDPLTF